jgi:centrosomal protein CEP104
MFNFKFFKVIEVAAQNSHLVMECQFKNNYKKCPRCTEAVQITNVTSNEYHFKGKQCTPITKNGQRCPLCHSNIKAGEEGWKEHLMTPNNCPKNNRKLSNQPEAVRKISNRK